MFVISDVTDTKQLFFAIYNWKWHAPLTAHGNDYLGQKKFKQIYQYRANDTYCNYMGDYEKL